MSRQSYCLCVWSFSSLDSQAVIDWDLVNNTDNVDDYFFYKLDNASAYPIGNVGVREGDSFDTDVDLTDLEGASVWRQPMRGKIYQAVYFPSLQ